MSDSERSTRIFNTTVVATKAVKFTNHGAKLSALLSVPAFQRILDAISNHARTAGISEERAAEEIIQTFRSIDELWDSYVYQEGIEKLKTHLGNS